MTDKNNNDIIDNTKVRKPLPKAMKLNNNAWYSTAGAAGSHDCSAGCQQTIVGKTCRC